MENKEIRLLTADEIECRVGMCSEKGVSLLLYKDARCDMKILDEVFGPDNWQRGHEVIGGNLYCSVSVWNAEKKQWISKQDVCTNGNTEKEKSQASDSFKRACVNWGIGRELYTAPFIWISAGKTSIKEKSGKYVCEDSFSVKSIEYDANREIVGLVIMNRSDEAVYEFEAKKIVRMPTAKVQLTTIQKHELEKELSRTGIDVGTVMKRYKINRPDDISPEVYEKIMKALAKTKSAA